MPNSPPHGEAVLERNRFVAFALTAAELLVEVDPETGISFATGAFRARFGEAPEAFLGKAAETLFAPEDRAEFLLAMSVLAADGRLPPRILRVNDSERSEMIISGLAPSSTRQRVFLTLAENPRSRAFQDPLLPETVPQRAERKLREGSGGSLALLQLPQGLATAMDRTPALRSALTRELGPTEELVRGRVGVLASGTDGLAALTAAAERILTEYGIGGSVMARSVALDAGALSAVQATRALRHVLSAFSRDGVQGVDALGAAGGLDAAMNRLKSDVASLRRVLTSRRFNLAFQPIVDLADGAVHH
ncbi:PAS domain-containing protein, partial [Plastoroseomonas hellenica]|uniref:PAS domain-containing protein n=1 Tax=Plastoroseomonas hellenica TaxID=2687306 RepID=UPI001BAAF978